MKANKPPIKSSLKDIATLYQDETIIKLFNDLVAIGTWPTPEKPVPDIKGEKQIIKRNADGTIAIDSVPLPEKPKYLKLLIYELLEISGNTKVAELI
jgi:hypothetical protein